MTTHPKREDPPSSTLRLLLAPLLACLTLTGVACSQPGKAGGTENPDDVVEVRVGNRQRGTGQTTLGITHTQFSADKDNDPSAVRLSRQLMSRLPLFQNQHIMGWGALSPEPSPDVYDWASLDARVDLIRETAGVPVLTLCCAPDWMKLGSTGKTDWRNLNRAPDPRHYADFASLARQVAMRYPDVKHYQVWQGMKGFYDPRQNRWNYEGYTDLYNLVYQELKAVDAEIKVGGPQVAMDSWADADNMTKASDLKGSWGVMDQRAMDAIDYWLEHKKGADFISLDTSAANKDGVSLGSAFRSIAKMEAIARWIRARTDLPLWAARWHPFPPRSESWGLGQQSALLAAGFVQLINSSVEVALVWQPQGRNERCSGCLWTDTRFPGGGQFTAAYESLEALVTSFPPGTPLLETETSSAHVTAISSPTVTVLINELAQPRDVRVNDVPVELGSYEVRVVPRDLTGSPGKAGDPLTPEPR